MAAINSNNVQLTGRNDVQARVRKFPSQVITNKVNCYEKVMALHKNGTVYGRGGSGEVLRKSTNWGSTWSTAFTFTSGLTIKQVLLTDSGRIVVAMDNGSVWTSDVNGANFTQTLTMTAGTFVHDMFGATVFGDTIGLAEYSGTKNPSTATGAWYSEDGGQTWTRFFNETTKPTGFHLHDIKYDPYEDMFWITSGDGDGNRAVYYSKNRGQTWFRSDIPFQATTILPLPECVLFVSDSPTVGVQRYNRLETGTPTANGLAIEMALPVATDWAGEVPIGCVPLVTYGGDACVYFGWSMSDNAKPGGKELKYAQIYATRDGREFWPIYRTDKPATHSGYYGGYGPDANGNILFTVLDRNQGAQTCNNIIMNQKMWKVR